MLLGCVDAMNEEQEGNVNHVRLIAFRTVGGVTTEGVLAVNGYLAEL
jgi:predicted metal-binding protein